MGSSLRDIPGAGSSGRRRGDRKASGPVRTPHVPVARQPGGGAPRKTGPGRRRSFSSRQSVDRVNLVLGLAFAALAVFGLVWLWNMNQVSVSATGVQQGATITPQQAVGLTIEIDVSPATRLGSAVLTFDGEDVTDDGNVEVTDNGFVWHSPPAVGLENGEHTIGLEVKRVIKGSYDWDLTFEVAPAS